MKLMQQCLGVAFGLGLVAALGCEYDEPCDPGQTFEGQVCLDPPEEEAPAPAADEAPPAADMASADAGDGGSEPEQAEEPEEVSAEFGQACEDDTASSDCGGEAPICLPQLFVCSNVLCQDGEPNAGACPAGWICLVVDPSQPSVCLDPAFLQ